MKNNIFKFFLTGYILFQSAFAQTPAFAFQTELGWKCIDNQGNECYNPLITGIFKPNMYCGNKLVVLRANKGSAMTINEVTDFKGNLRIKPQVKEDYRIDKISSDEPFLGLGHYMENYKQFIFDKSGKIVFESESGLVELLDKGYFAYAQESPEAVSHPILNWTVKNPFTNKTAQVKAADIHPFAKNNILPISFGSNISFLDSNFKTFLPENTDFIQNIIESSNSYQQYLDEQFAEEKYIPSRFPWTLTLKFEGEVGVNQIIDSKGKLTKYAASAIQDAPYGISLIQFDSKALFLDKNFKEYPISVNIEDKFQTDLEANPVGLVKVQLDNTMIYSQFGKKVIVKSDEIEGNVYLSEKFAFFNNKNDKKLYKVDSSGKRTVLELFNIEKKFDKGFIINDLNEKFVEFQDWKKGWMSNLGNVFILPGYDLIEPGDQCIFARKMDKKADIVIWDVYNYEGKLIMKDVFKTQKSTYIRQLNSIRINIPD